MLDTKLIMKVGTKVMVHTAGAGVGLLACQKGTEMLTKDGQPVSAVAQYAPPAVCILLGGYLTTQENEHVQGFGAGLAIGGGLKAAHTVANKTPGTLKMGLGSASSGDMTYVPLDRMLDLGNADDDYEFRSDSDIDDELEGAEDDEDFDLGGVDDVDLGSANDSDVIYLGDRNAA